MNALIEFLNSHASVRRFTNKEITREQEQIILTTAQRSPTSSNLQACSVISVRNEITKKRLAELSGNQQHIIDCPLFLVFCADLYRLKMIADRRNYPFHGDTTESFIVATVDTALVASRALMAAQAIGLGGVMVGGIRNHPDEVSTLLALPDMTCPVMGMSLGHPAVKPKLKPRLPLEGVAFREHYDPDAAMRAVEAYDQTISQLGYLQGREVEAEKYPKFTDTYSWSEHAARRMASDNPGTVRLHMLPYLQSQGLLEE